MKNVQHIRTDDMELHIIYAGLTYWAESIIGPGDLYAFYLLMVIYRTMQKYNIKSAILTMISMFKGQLITKEEMEYYYKAHFEDDDDFSPTTSLQDDLEFFLEQIRRGNDFELWATPPGLLTFYLPKLTDEEMILVKNKDEDYLRTFMQFYGEESPDYISGPDIDEEEMKLSESKSKFAFWVCFRKSDRLTL